MNKVSGVLVVLAGIAGLIIGAIVTAVVKMVAPGTNLALMLIATCLPSLLSGVVGSLIGARQKLKKQSAGG
jgi:hypothetical protein